MDTFDANVIAHLVDCTATENQTCRIADKLSVMNRLLLGSITELREHPDTCGQLHLDNSERRSTVKTLRALQLPHYPELLPWLLRTHRCISSVDVKPSLNNNAGLTILEALPHNSGIKTLTLHLYETWAVNAASTVLPCLTNIRELHCAGFIKPGDPVLSVFMTALSKLLTCSSSLESLRLVNTTLDALLADSFFTTLSHQSQLKELNLLTSSLQCNSYPYAFAEYLATTTVLKVLVVSVTNELVQKAVLKGVSENSSIEELFLNDFTGNQESTAIVARMISSNRVLRKLTVYTKDDTEPGMPTTYYCWILALFENETLEEVKFPLLILSPSQWSVLFQALPTKQNLKKVHIDAGVDVHQLVPLLCTELISSGSDEKVSISCLSFRYDVGFLQCKAFSGANFFFADDRAVAALRILPSCRHLTSLTMHIQVGKLTISSALASLLESTTALRKLKLLVNTGAEVGAGDDSRWWSRVLEALSHNHSLRELLYTLFFTSDRITAAFADCVRGSKNIRWVEFDGDTTEHANAFMRHLAKDIAKNYTLLTVVCYGNVDADFARDWLAVQETTRRNSNLVARAARLLKASRFDRYVIRALERVSLYPALMDEVAEQVKTDKAELASLVQDRLRGTKSLDGFMRFTGVVRGSVVCHPSDDGRMQLDSLNEDCWRHIRKYLYIDDVK